MSKKHRHDHDDVDLRGEDGARPWALQLTMGVDADERVALVELFAGPVAYEAHGRAPSRGDGTTIGDELAVSRALANLAHQLVEDGARRIQEAEATLVAQAETAAVALEEIG